MKNSEVFLLVVTDCFYFARGLLYVFILLSLSLWDDTRVKRSKIRCKLACKSIFELGTRQKHEKVAIFRRKMSGFRMFLRIARAQSAEQSGIKEVKIPFDLNIMGYI